MPDPKQLPHLLKLIDDNSEIVQEKVLEELSAYGPTLQQELVRLNVLPETSEFREILSRLEEHNRRWLRNQWPLTLETGNEKKRLEEALSLLADFQNGRRYPKKLTPLLDQLSTEFQTRMRKHDALELADFLFKKKGFRGVQADFYNPMNSNLVYVIEQLQGIPISLACIYILVGDRLGFDIRGINTPGHFLARATVARKPYVVDCFNGGRFFDESDIANFNPRSPVHIKDILALECSSDTIIARVLRNLANSYKHAGNLVNLRFMAELLEMIDLGDDEAES